MNPEEYARLDSVEGEHWFYRGKRAVVRHWIGRYVALAPDDVAVDAGMGTGRWLAELASACRVVGIDSRAESLDLARSRVEALGGRVVQSSLEQVDLPDGCATVVTLLDVIEHLDDDRAAFSEMLRIARPGGLVIVTVPAMRWLWSDWDVALHHRRRYERAALLEVLRHPEAELLHCAYLNPWLLAPIAAVRALRRIKPVRGGGTRAEDRIPPRALNELFFRQMVYFSTRRWFRPPAGLSLLAVVRRKHGSGRIREEAEPLSP